MGDVIALWEQGKTILAALARIEGKIDTMPSKTDLDAAIATAEQAVNDAADRTQRVIILKDSDRAAVQAALDAANAEIADLKQNQVGADEITAVQHLADLATAILGDQTQPLPPAPTP